jgi:hypothetical protein
LKRGNSKGDVLPMFDQREDVGNSRDKRRGMMPMEEVLKMPPRKRRKRRKDNELCDDGKDLNVECRPGDNWHNGKADAAQNGYFGAVSDHFSSEGIC